ncbi:hypothetical protein Tco_0874456 [Tanacetum coccineum]|uniref:Reverse transcriptase Ty1/copia-type domain-containing protein n=1 Tax=Tanacetum coccineum TaxID=301880 RepID=A0ABQ5BLM6_9ASTR
MQEELNELERLEVWELKFSKGTVDLTLFIRREGKDILLMSMMGKLSFFLGLQISQSPRGIFLNQSKYALESLNKYGMETCDLVDTPMTEKSKLDEDPQGKAVDPTCYHEMIGTLMYLTSSRPDLVFAVCMCARYQVKPIEKHLHAVKRIFRYLRGTINMGMWYSKDSCIALTNFTDVDHAGCQDTRKSTSGSSTRYLCTAITKVKLLYAATTSNITDPSILTSDITLSRSKWRTGRSLSLQKSLKSLCSSSGTLSRRSKTQNLMNSFWPTRSALSMLKSLERFWVSVQELKVKNLLRYKMMMLPPPSSLTLATKIDHKKERKSRRKTMLFPQFTKVIINHFLSQHKSLSNHKFQRYHTIKDDGIVSIIKFVRIGEDYQEYGLPIPDMMLNDAIKRLESYQMFLKYLTGQIPPKKSRGKGSQGNKTADTLVADVNVSKEFDLEPARKRTTSRRVVKKNTIISAADNIIPDPDVALELGKSISLTEAAKEKAARQVHATHARIVNESELKPTKKKIEQEATDIMQALKESKKTNRRQPGTRGSNEGTSVSLWVPNESTVVPPTSTK